MPAIPGVRRIVCRVLFGLWLLRQLTQALRGKLEPADGFRGEAPGPVGAAAPLREDGGAEYLRIVDTAKDAFEPGGIAQFEKIHPFLDGNGRIGRLLITLSLMNDHALSTAVFYPSYQFKLRRSEYYGRLMGVREHDEYAAWVRFFCECLLASADDAAGSLMRLVELHNNNIALVNGMLGRSSANGLRLLELLEETP